MEQLDFVLRVLQVALGIGMVIFIHEAGHFIAARLCGVRVEVFSLGFGPRLVGWRRGPTTYQISAVPLGGYVRMKGEEGAAGAFGNQSDALWSKSVGQRFFIYSAGVLMNVAVAAAVFPFLFAHGVPFQPPLLGQIAPGSAAWEADLAPEDEVLAVDGAEVISWDDVMLSVALGDPERSTLLVRDAETGGVSEVELRPAYNEVFGISSIGLVRPPVDPRGRLAIAPDSPAAEAGLEDGDRLLAVAGGLPGLPLLEQLYELFERGAPLDMLVADETGAERRVVVTPDEGESSSPRLGIVSAVRKVAGVRIGTPAAEILRADDRVLALAGEPIWRAHDLRRLLLAQDGPATLTLRRGDEVVDTLLPAMDTDAAVAFLDDVALGPDVASTVVAVRPGETAEELGLRDGDRVLRIDGEDVKRWEQIVDVLRDAGSARATVEIWIERRDADGSTQTLTFAASPQPQPSWTYGLNLRDASYVYQTDGVVESLQVGLASSWDLLRKTWLMLKKMVRAEVSTENMGGIITIGAVSYTWAEEGWAKLLYFLCMLSINLALLNVLPIPVLDGGHLFFLLVEKIKGSPVSERVLGYSQMVGLVLILSLMVYVTFNDIQRWFFPGS